MANLYDDASLVMIPTAYKDGKLYSHKPVEELGDELVTDRGFDDASNWVLTLGSPTISGSTANFTASGDYVIQNNVVPLSVKTYKLEYEIKSSNGLGLRLSGGSGFVSPTSLESTIGKHSIYLTSNGTKRNLQFNSTGFIGSIDNVSVKEVLTELGDFTFTRGSNLAATRVDVNGLIEKGRENLLLQSNQFDTTWNLQNLSVASGQSGYDGSSDAWKVTPSTSNTYHRLTNAVSGAANSVVTLSVYAKANGYNFLRVTENATTGDYATFNLSNGSVSSNTSLHATIESVGGGWYRCSSTIIPAASHRFDIYVMETATIQEPWAGNGTDGILIQDAQLEAGLVATDYIETGASTAQAGILEDMPRLDYSGGALCPSLLLEPQRSNLITQSEYLNGLNKIGTTISTNETTSPEGVKNAHKITGNGSSGDHQLYATSISFTSGTAYTFSIFAKADTNDFVQFVTSGAAFGNNAYANYDLSSGTMGTIGSSATASIEDYGDGWYRCILTATATATTSSSISLFMITSATASRGESNTLSTSSYLYGWQVESGSYPTSYIPTYGASVTRSVDSCGANDSDIINQDEGTLFIDFVFDGKQDSIDYYHFAIIDSYGQNEIRLGGYNLALYGRVYSGGTLTFAQNYSSVATIGQRYKVIIKYGSEGVKTFANGQLKHSGTPTLPTGTMDKIRLTRSGVGTHSSINQSVYFPTALTDAECIALTE